MLVDNASLKVLPLPVHVSRRVQLNFITEIFIVPVPQWHDSELTNTRFLYVFHWCNTIGTVTVLSVYGLHMFLKCVLNVFKTGIALFLYKMNISCVLL
jgi:hypothetical protein